MTAQGARRRPKVRTMVIAAVGAVLVLGVGALVVSNIMNSGRVDPSELTITPQPKAVPANEPVVAAPTDADFASVVDVTADLSGMFVGDIADVRGRTQGEQKMPPAAEPDACLLEWAKANLAPLAATGAYQVVDVCGRATAVLAGPLGADTKVLVYGALEADAPAGMLQVMGESTSEKMAFAAVRSADEQAQLIATAVLP